MRPLAIVAAAGMVLLLAADPADAQRKASGRDDGGSAPSESSGSKSGGSGSDSRPEPAPQPSREPVSRAPSQTESSRPPQRSRAVASSPSGSADARRVASERAGQRFAVARPAGTLDPRPVRVIYTTSHFPAFFGYSSWGYDPWGYGRYSGWYSPYGYGYWPGYYGFGYWAPVYYGGYAGGGYADDDGDAREPREATGSIRFRVEPKHAAIYVDGALAGIVDDFDGLTNHLRLPAGTHTYELRAEGYQSHTGTLTVVTGQTRTERVSLKRAGASQ